VSKLTLQKNMQSIVEYMLKKNVKEI